MTICVSPSAIRTPRLSFDDLNQNIHARQCLKRSNSLQVSLIAGWLSLPRCISPPWRQRQCLLLRRACSSCENYKQMIKKMQNFIKQRHKERECERYNLVLGYLPRRRCFLGQFFLFLVSHSIFILFCFLLTFSRNNMQQSTLKHIQGLKEYWAYTLPARRTWKFVPSSSLNAFRACSENMNVTKAKPLIFFEILSIGKFTSVNSPGNEKKTIKYFVTIYIKQSIPVS